MHIIKYSILFINPASLTKVTLKLRKNNDIHDINKH